MSYDRNSLAGKDYLTEDEAAFYTCVSLSQFKKRINELGILYGVSMGKKFYRRIDLSKMMEEAWQRSNPRAMAEHGY